MSAFSWKNNSSLKKSKEFFDVLKFWDHWTDYDFCILQKQRRDGTWEEIATHVEEFPTLDPRLTAASYLQRDKRCCHAAQSPEKSNIFFFFFLSNCCQIACHLIRFQLQRIPFDPPPQKKRLHLCWNFEGHSLSRHYFFLFS